jgi:hypothetical protein
MPGSGWVGCPCRWVRFRDDTLNLPDPLSGFNGQSGSGMKDYVLAVAPLGNAFKAAMASSVWERLLKGDEDVAAPSGWGLWQESTGPR